MLVLLAAATLAAQSADEVFVRARRKILAAVDRLPNYTCVQTLDRQYFKRTVTWESCDGEQDKTASRGRAKLQIGDRGLEVKSQPESAGGGAVSHLELWETDRYRLDVRVSSAGREIYSWAGAPRFNAAGLQEIVASGAIASGSFGPFLINIFGRRGVEFKYRGSDAVDGKTLQKYSYRVPQTVSRYDYRSGGQNRFIAFDGAFWVDPASADLVRLEIHTDAMPHYTGTCEATSVVDFHRILVAGQDYLLARTSTLNVSALPGHYVNTNDYSACRGFAAESGIRFEDGESKVTQPKAASAQKRLPAGIHLVLALEQPLDGRTAAGGDVIRARVVKDAAARTAGPVAAPEGAIAEGRISRFTHQLSTPPQFLVAIEWQTLRWGGNTIPFSAILVLPENSFTVRASDLARGTPPSNGRRVADGHALVFPADKDQDMIPAGSESTWVSR
jgi:hypothetical protein